MTPHFYRQMPGLLVHRSLIQPGTTGLVATEAAFYTGVAFCCTGFYYVADRLGFSYSWHCPPKPKLIDGATFAWLAGRLVCWLAGWLAGWLETAKTSIRTNAKTRGQDVLGCMGAALCCTELVFCCTGVAFCRTGAAFCCTGDSFCRRGALFCY